MDKNTFSFDLLDRDTPEVVIKRSLEQIAEATQGYVNGNIEEYSGEISTYTKRSGIAAISRSLEAITVDIQEDLGEQDGEKHRFEVFLTVKDLKHYKYRMMFVDYGTISYPVTIVMNEALAIEYCGKRKDTFLIESMKELETMLDVIINSNTMVNLIQSLINESLRKEISNEETDLPNADNSDEM